MKRLSAVFALAIGMLLGALPAAAATSFVQDGAAMFSPGTVAQLNNTIANFNAQTGKQVVVVTVPSLGGDTLQDAAQKVFSQQQVNGVLIFVAKDDRKDIIVPGRATAAFFPAETTRSIRESMESQFRDGDYDGGITTAVNGVLDIFRAHLSSAPNANSGNRAYNYPATTSRGYVRQNSGVHISMFWWIVIIIGGFMIVRSIMRASSGPRYYGGGPGVGPGGAPMGGPGYGGYGPGYYGGGGGFWSGLLGGLGGAFLGNELFGNRGGTNIVDPGAGNVVQGDQGGGWGGGDASGWGNDAGQADMGSSSAGDWSGGGFGGGGDSGGGFGGGGDSGGGW